MRRYSQQLEWVATARARQSFYTEASLGGRCRWVAYTPLRPTSIPTQATCPDIKGKGRLDSKTGGTPVIVVASHLGWPIVFKWKMLVSYTEKNEYRKVVQVKLNGCIDEEFISVKTERLCGEGGSPRQHGLGSLSFQEPPGSYLSLSLLLRWSQSQG